MNKLLELKKDTKILYINFNKYNVYNIGYTTIIFTKDNRKEWQGGQHFSASSPAGCSSWIFDEQLEKHCFLSDFSSSMYFFTLKPEQWKEDLKLEMKFLIKNEKKTFLKSKKSFTNKINLLILNNKPNNLNQVKLKTYQKEEETKLLRKLKLNKLSYD